MGPYRGRLAVSLFSAAMVASKKPLRCLQLRCQEGERVVYVPAAVARRIAYNFLSSVVSPSHTLTQFELNQGSLLSSSGYYHKRRGGN